MLERLGVWTRLKAEQPVRIVRWSASIGGRRIEHRLPESAFGISRYRFDAILAEESRRRGAVWHAERTAAHRRAIHGPHVIAYGRHPGPQPKGRRLFGFKSHFEGPVNDAVELFFFDGCYVGVSSIEDGLTNVCGLGPEDRLARVGFHYDELLHHHLPLRQRIAPLRRKMDWLSTGPLVFANRLEQPGAEGEYPAGDALSFVDPFTGSGLLCAVVSGDLAGLAAAEGWPVHFYFQQARSRLKRPFVFSSLVRTAITSGIADRLLGWAPARWLFRATRPGAIESA